MNGLRDYSYVAFDLSRRRFVYLAAGVYCTAAIRWLVDGRRKQRSAAKQGRTKKKSFLMLQLWGRVD